MKKLLFLILLLFSFTISASALRYVWPPDVKYDLSIDTNGTNTVTGLPMWNVPGTLTTGTDADGNYLIFNQVEYGAITYTVKSDSMASTVITIQIKTKFPAKPAGSLGHGYTIFEKAEGGGNQNYRGGYFTGWTAATPNYDFYWYFGYEPSWNAIPNLITPAVKTTVQMVYYKQGFTDTSNCRQKIYFIVDDVITYKSDTWNWGYSNAGFYENEHWLFGTSQANASLAPIQIYEVLFAIGKDYYGTEIEAIGVTENIVVSKDAMKYINKSDMGY